MISEATISFLKKLESNNNRDWFQEHKKTYSADLKQPSEALRDALIAHMSARTGMQTSGKLFRINRDVRFSKDKTPYNAHVRLSVIDGDNPAAAWMVSIEPTRLIIGYGQFAFEPKTLASYRARIDADGDQLAKIVAEGVSDGQRIDEPELKRIPSPFAKDHPHGALLRRKGLAMWIDDLPLESVFGEDAPARLGDQMMRFERLRKWMNSI